MKKLIPLAIFLMSSLASAQEIQFKPGVLGLKVFLGLVSEKLDLRIDASAVGPDSAERVSVPSFGPLSPERGKAFVLSALYQLGYTWIHDAPTDIYRIVRVRDARDQEIRLFSENQDLPDSDELVTSIIPIQNVSAETVARNMRSFMPANSRIIPEEGSRVVFITDSAHNIRKLRELVLRLDTSQNAAIEKEHPESHHKKSPCGSFESHPEGTSSTVLITLFALIAAVMGFLLRGYIIRRIEGGL